MEDFDASATLYDYKFVLPFERDFSPTDARQWMEARWHMSIYISIIYLVLIFGVRHLMTNRKPFSLNKSLILWNLGLAIFSIIAFCRTIPEFWHTFTNYGFYHSICVPSYLVDDKVSSFWNFMFILSKLPELGDTVFIVLRKRPLIFLHWYHHILTLLFAWYSFKEFGSSSRWFSVMNLFVHSIMYSYYTLKAMRLHIPKFVSILITSSQISQMALGCYISYKSWHFILIGLPCYVSYKYLILSSLMYLSYLMLFIRFFKVAYFGKPNLTKATKVQ